MRKPELRYVIITPARNEETYIQKALDSIVSQTIPPLKWIIVNDGSTDRTAEIVRSYATRYPFIEIVDMPVHRDRSFAAKAHCFNTGFEQAKNLDYDVIGNLDADISFDSDYFEFLLEKFESTPDLGVAGTTFREEGYDSASDSFEGEIHVAGGCQLFRRACFEELGGYVPNKAGGVDWIAVTTARMKGWKTRSFREKYFFHYRSLGTAERNNLSATFSYGEKDYYLGGSPIWEIFRVLYRMTKKPLLLGGLALLAGYTWAALKRIDRPVSRELMHFHRKEQMRKLRLILLSILRLKKVDNFQLMTNEERHPRPATPE